MPAGPKGSRASRPTAWPRPACGRRRALRRDRGDQTERKYQVVRGLNNLGIREKRACRVVGLSHATYYDIKSTSPVFEIRHLGVIRDGCR